MHAAAKLDFAKDLFKLMMNTVFGKTMENLRKIIDFNVVTSRKMVLKRIAKPNLKTAKIFREDLVGIHMTKPLLVLDYPIQVGFTNQGLEFDDALDYVAEKEKDLIVTARENARIETLLKGEWRIFLK